MELHGAELLIRHTFHRKRNISIVRTGNFIMYALGPFSMIPYVHVHVEQHHKSTWCIHKSTWCIHKSTQCIHKSTWCIHKSTWCIHKSTRCIHKSTRCIHKSTWCIHKSTGCIHKSTRCIHKSTQCIHKSTWCIHKHTSMSMLWSLLVAEEHFTALGTLQEGSHFSVLLTQQSLHHLCGWVCPDQCNHSNHTPHTQHTRA